MWIERNPKGKGYCNWCGLSRPLFRAQVQMQLVWIAQSPKPIDGLVQLVWIAQIPKPINGLVQLVWIERNPKPINGLAELD